MRRGRLRSMVVVVAANIVGSSCGGEPPPTPSEAAEGESGADDDEGEPARITAGVHDPARLVPHQGKLFLAASPIETWSFDSTDDPGEVLSDDVYGDEPPTWDFVDDKGEPLRKYWAPSVLVAPWEPSRLLMYHSAVSIDENTGISRIGFALSSGELPNLTWTAAESFVVESTNAEGQEPESREADPFAIDPAVFFDEPTGRLWMVYGSHGPGIYLIELDAQTGYVKQESAGVRIEADDPRAKLVAARVESNVGNQIEAAYLHRHDDWYYLFVNWDVCCGGVESSYNIRVGRAETVEGPYLDHEGVDLADGGGSMFLDADGEVLGDPRFIGPGHIGIADIDGEVWITHHFYDGAPGADPGGSLAMWRISYEDGWPVL